MKCNQIVKLLTRSFDVWSDAKAPTLGASLAYYTAFSIAPLLVLLLGGAAMIFGPQAARGRLAGEMEMIVGSKVAQATESMLAHAEQTPSSGPLALVVSVVILLFGASGVFAELQTALNAIWMVEPKPGRGIWGVIKDRFFSFLTLLGTCFLLLTSLVISSLLSALGTLWTPSAIPGGTYLWQGVNFLVSLGVITMLFAMLYKYVPDAKIEWRDVWLGAAVTAVLFTVGRHLLALYLGYAATTSSYGAAGSLVVILLWVYYTSQIFLFGAAFTRVYAEWCGRAVEPMPNAMDVSRVVQAKQEAEKQVTEEATKPSPVQL